METKTNTNCEKEIKVVPMPTLETTATDEELSVRAKENDVLRKEFALSVKQHILTNTESGVSDLVLNVLTLNIDYYLQKNFVPGDEKVSIINWLEKSYIGLLHLLFSTTPPGFTQRQFYQCAIVLSGLLPSHGFVNVPEWVKILSQIWFPPSWGTFFGGGSSKGEFEEPAFSFNMYFKNKLFHWGKQWPLETLLSVSGVCLSGGESINLWLQPRNETSKFINFNSNNSNNSYIELWIFGPDEEARKSTLTETLHILKNTISRYIVVHNKSTITFFMFGHPPLRIFLTNKTRPEDISFGFKEDYLMSYMTNKSVFASWKAISSWHTGEVNAENMNSTCILKALDKNFTPVPMPNEETLQKWRLEEEWVQMYNKYVTVSDLETLEHSAYIAKILFQTKNVFLDIDYIFELVSQTENFDF